MAGLHNFVGQMSVLKELTVHCKASEKKGCHLKSPVVEKPGLTEEREDKNEPMELLFD